MWNCERTHQQVNNTQTIDSKQNDVQLILNILPYSYEGVIQNISNQDQPVNFEWLNTKLLNESHKMQLWTRQLGDDELLIVQLQQLPFWGKGRWHCNYGGRPTPPKTFEYKKWHGITCYICGKEGHLAKQCAMRIFPLQIHGNVAKLYDNARETLETSFIEIK